MILSWEDPLEKGKATQYSGMENSMNSPCIVPCIVHGVAKSWTRLSDFHSLHSLVSSAGVISPILKIRTCRPKEV